MEFKKYQHVERYGTTAVEGIELGTTFVFPKIDGSNCQVYYDGEVKCGSRNRELTLEKDNAGFMAYIETQDNIKKCVTENKQLRLYGEWLTPHSLKTYRDDAWRHFYVFDVMEQLEDGNERYLPYNEYKPIMDKYGIDYITPLCSLKNASYDDFIKNLDKNVFLIEDGKGCGEGIVIKNYDYKNKFGHIIWAKIVTSEFREKHARTFNNTDRPQECKQMTEIEIVEKYVTSALCEKVKAKVIDECGDWSSKYIPRVLNMVYYDLVNEDCWNFVKEFKQPTINFKTLMSVCYSRTKKILNF